jgi:hypothetical protein
MDEAITMHAHQNIRWLPRPWYHDEGQPGSRSPVTRPSNWCVYCDSCMHAARDCPDPHALCPDRLSCIIPSYHKHSTGFCPSDPRRHLLEEMINELSRNSNDEDVDWNPYDTDGEA